MTLIECICSPDETELISIFHRSAMISTCLTRVRSIESTCNHYLRTDIKRVAVVIRGRRLRLVTSTKLAAVLESCIARCYVNWSAHCHNLGEDYVGYLSCNEI